VSVVDLPPGIGLQGTPLGIFRSPRRWRRLAAATVIASVVLGGLTWYFVARRPWQRGASVLITLPVAFAALGLLGLAVRHASISVTRDGVRWGWSFFGFHQQAGRLKCAHIYRDGVALEARRGSWWFLAARDWDRFDALVRQLRRAELPLADHDRRAPFRARLQSYGRVLDLLLAGTIAASVAVAVWAS
jgi:hypothetical protein